jgi:microcystin-dependent protein
MLRLIREGESETLEFKESFGKDVIETVCAFGNSRGVTILVGVYDNGDNRQTPNGAPPKYPLSTHQVSPKHPRIQEEADLTLEGKKLLGFCPKPKNVQSITPQRREATSMKKFALLLLCLGLPFLMAYAAVPSRITYQGRLSKSGVGAAGRHTIFVQFIDKDGNNLPAAQPFDVDVPASGDFSLDITNIPPDADWINGLPKMRVIVGGETLTPDQSFSATPYALVARNVENLDTSKVKLAGSTTGSLLSSWQSPDDPTRINSKSVLGPIEVTTNHGAEHGLLGKDKIPAGTLSPSQIMDTALVLTSSVTQTIQPTEPVVPLVVKGQKNTGPNSTNMFEVWDNAAIPSKQFHIQDFGTAFFKGNVGIGSLEPKAKLEVAGRILDKTGDVMPVGTVLPFAGINIPQGWLLCDGTMYSISARPDLNDLRQALGSTYGGNGTTDFAVPDMRGRIPMGSGKGSGLTARTVGQIPGEENHAMTLTESPPHAHEGISNSGGGEHTHSSTILSSNLQTIGTGQDWVFFSNSKLIYGFNATGSGDNISMQGYDHTHVIGGGKDSMHSHAFTTNGMKPGDDTQGKPHNIIQPSLVLNYIIKY